MDDKVEMIRTNQNSFINVKTQKYMAQMKNMTETQNRYKDSQNTYSNRIQHAYEEADDARETSTILEQEKEFLVNQLQHISAEELGMLDKLESLSGKNATMYNV